MKAVRFLKTGIGVLLCLSAFTAYPAEPKQRPSASDKLPFAILVTVILEKRPEYQGLKALYEGRRRREGSAWEQSAEGRKMSSTLESLLLEAWSVRDTDPLHPSSERIINYTGADGSLNRLTSIVPSYTDPGAPEREDVARMIAGNIVREAVWDGRIPAEVSPGYKAAMTKGYAAAKQRDYRAAINQFLNASEIAPKAAAIYYNLALAEAQIVGREQRAVVWFGAFLAANPKTPKAAAILAEMKALNVRGLSRFLALTEQIARQNPHSWDRRSSLTHSVELWAKAGDYPAAFKVIDDIWGVDMIGYSHGLIVRAQLAEGDLQGALQTIERIEDLYSKSSGLEEVAAAQAKMGNKTGALNTLAAALALSERIDNETDRISRKMVIAYYQSQAGDITAAFRTADSIIDPFSNSITKAWLAEAQAKAGDTEGSRRTLAAVQQSIERIDVPRSKTLAVTRYNEVKARIAAGTAGSAWGAWTEAVAANPPATRADWVSMNVSGILDAPVYLDLKSYLTTVPTDEPKKAFHTMYSTATKMIAAQNSVKGMLKTLGFYLP